MTESVHGISTSIDVTYVAYYGDRDELIRVQGAPEDKSYDWCYKFATANVVGDNVHFAAGMLPVGHAHYHDPDAYPGKDKSYRVSDVVRRLVDHVSDVCRIHVRRLFADAEFYATEVFARLDQRDIFYVIPAPRDDRGAGRGSTGRHRLHHKRQKRPNPG